MASEKTIVLPGDEIDLSEIPTHPKKALRLGPGLRHIPPSEIVPTVAGQLVTDRKKNSIWVEYGNGRYVPTAGDLVIGTVHHSAADVYHVSLAPHGAHATLPQLAFEGATKKTKPNLAPGALVYARVALANRHMDAELECVSPQTGKADGLGPLACAPPATAAATVFSVAAATARRLLLADPTATTTAAAAAAARSGLVVLDALADAGLAFETAVGRNGRVWVAAPTARTVLAVGRALTETDERHLDVRAQRKLVARLVAELGVGKQ